MLFSLDQEAEIESSWPRATIELSRSFLLRFTKPWDFSKQVGVAVQCRERWKKTQIDRMFLLYLRRGEVANQIS